MSTFGCSQKDTIAHSRLSRTTVLHIEDDSYFGYIVTELLARWPEICHIGTVTGISEALPLYREKEPAIVLLDLWLPDGDGLELIERLAILPRPPRILLLTSRRDDLTLYHAWSKQDKVAGLIWKTNHCHEQLRVGLAAVSKGQRYFPSEVAEAIYRFRTSPDAFHKLLNARQQELMNHFARGESDNRIASQLGTTEEAVRSYKKRIMRALNLRRFYDLAVWATQKGFGGKPPPGWPQ